MAACHELVMCLQEGHPHWHDGWRHGPVPGQPHGPGEGATADGGEEGVAGPGAKVGGAISGNGHHG